VVSQANQNALCAVDVEAQELRLVGEKFSQCFYFPAALSHHRFYHGCGFAEHVQCFAISGEMLQMLVRVEVSVNLPHGLGGF